MAKGVTWGCFCEHFLLTAYLDLRDMDGFEVSPRNMRRVEYFFGEKRGRFSLPPPTCFNRPIKNFDLGLEEK
jgi:hypothetical protein